MTLISLLQLIDLIKQSLTCHKIENSLQLYQMHRMAFVKGYLLLLYFSPLSQNRTPTVVASEIVRFS